MKQAFCAGIAIVAVLFSCTTMAQSKEEKKKNPKKEIRVNKQYDEQGNLIRYDSTFVYTWSSDTSRAHRLDSLPRNLQQLEQWQLQMKQFMRQSFANDSLIKRLIPQSQWPNDFFFNTPDNEKFFRDFQKMMEDHMKSREEYFNKMRQHMDSLHMRFHPKKKRNLQKQQEPQKKSKSRQI